MRFLRLTALAGLSLAIAAGVPAFGDSQARVVRLSDVQGDVRVDRNTGQGYEKAFLNLPITQGMKIQTGDDGRAELEFEDGSTLRLAPKAVIDVQHLFLRDSGAKVTDIRLQEGTAYYNFLGSKDDETSVSFARENLALKQAVRLRIEADDVEAAVAVFKGAVEVDGASGNVRVEKNQTASFDLSDDDRHELAKNIEPGPYDSWDKQQAQYHERYRDNSYASYSPYSYGTSDLRYYGSFFSAPGYGTLWQPYFVGAGWDPFMNGAWAFNSGFGYGWVSSYPWGWTPYHYGSWAFVPGYGWAWQPGGAWMGWNTVPVVLNAPPNFVAPRAPLPGPRGVVAVNRGPALAQPGRSPNRLEIRNNSAGLGIPRGSVRNLGQLSHDVAQRGSVTMRMPSTAPAPRWSGDPYGSGWTRPSAANSGNSARVGSSATHSMGSTSSSSHSSAGRSVGPRR